MTIICTFFLLILFVFGYLQNKSFNSPLNFLNILFTIIMFGASLGLFGMNKDCDEAALIVLTGMFFVNVGFFAGELYYQKKGMSRKPIQFKVKDNFEVNSVILFLMSLILIYFSVHYIFRTIKLFAQGYSLNMIRLFYFNSGAMEHLTGIEVNDIIGYGTVYLYAPVQHVFIALTSVIWFDADFLKNHKFWRIFVPILTIINMIISMITNGGRVVVVFMAVCAVMTFISTRKKERSLYSPVDNKERKRKRKRNIAIIVAIIVLIYVAYNITRTRQEGNSGFSMIKSIYTYFCGSIPNLQQKIQKSDNNYSYGVTLISGLIRPIFTGLRFLLKTPVPTVFSIGDSYLEASSQTDIIGSGMSYNSFVTMFYFFYRDLGVVGLILESFLAGFAFSILYNTAGKSPKKYVIYLILMQGLSMSFVRWQIMSVGYALSFYYALILFTRNRVSFYVRKK